MTIGTFQFTQLNWYGSYLVSYKCGGNMVYIHHNVNGKIIQLLCPFKKIYVSKVICYRDTVIGTMGGSPVLAMG